LNEDKKFKAITDWLKSNELQNIKELLDLYKDSLKYTKKQLVERYSNLSIFFDQLSSKKTHFMSRTEINKFNYREKGGITVNIDRHGDFIFSKKGYHRLAIAQFLNLKIPVAIGVVHKNSLLDGRFKSILDNSKFLKKVNDLK
jgi:hypothetical protein